MKDKFLLFIFLSIVFLIILSGCSNNQDKNQKNITKQKEIYQEKVENKSSTENYSLNEIAKHSTKNDCWFAVDNKVYNVTNFISAHPGGEAILLGCGKDATKLYNTRPMGSNTPHSQSAKNKLNDFYIGKLNNQ